MLLATRPEHHQLPAGDVVLLLGSDATAGISRDEARARQVQFGPNVLPGFERRGVFRRMLAQFTHPLIYVLLAAALLSGLLRDIADAGVIVAVVVINAVVGFVQEARAERALDALVAMVRTTANVVRDGERASVPSSDLVPGDVVLLDAGDKVPADLRLVATRGLRVDESALTGESAPVPKSPTELESETALAERTNMAYSGTLVVAGQGRGVAVDTGTATEMGRIHQLVGAAAPVATPLTRKIAGFSRMLTVAILALSAFGFFVGIVRGESWNDMVNATVALAVAAIPEGLPAALTITLAIGVSRMARRNAIVRSLPAVETLGSTTVICSDKTGTLTENRMTVEVVDAGGARFDVVGTGYGPEGELRLGGEQIDAARFAALHECLAGGVLCSDAQVVEVDGVWEVIGDPTEGALVAAARRAGIEPDELRARYPRLGTVPFDSAHGYMATRHRAPDQPGEIVYVKGGVERVAAMCATALDGDGHEVAFDAPAVLCAAEALAARALRVLAIARATGESTFDRLRRGEVDPADFTFVGLQAMADPPRAAAITAVAACRDAGIDVKMITGDHAATAGAIARRFGIGVGDDGAVGGPRVVAGVELAACTPHERAELVQRTSVFARVSPAQKLQLVESLQDRGQVVAMTGDGVNDAPALRQADIGIAMGRAGTEVAKESADMVLTDDDFASIEAAVEEGRGVFDNLTKYIVWTLPTNMGEALAVLVAIVAGTTLPILPIQILWINLTTAATLGLTFAFEAKETGIMRRRPRAPGEPILTKPLLARILTVSVILVVAAFALFYWERHRGTPIEEARTAAVNCFVFVELAYLFNCRSLDRPFARLGLFANRVLLLGIVAIVGLQLAFTYVPFMQELFESAALEAGAWIRIVGISVACYLVIELEKAVRRLVVRFRVS